MLDEANQDTQLIRRLASAMPTAPAIDPVTIAFESGRRAGARSAARWRVATGVAAMCAVALAAWPRQEIDTLSGGGGGAIVAAVDPTGPTLLENGKSLGEPPDETGALSVPTTIRPRPTVDPYGTLSSDRSLRLRDAVLAQGIEGLPLRLSNRGPQQAVVTRPRPVW